MSHDSNAVVDELFAILGGPPGQAHYGEGVTQLAHGLQCAYFAAQAGANDETVIAALLHDIGHMCDPAASRMSGEIGTVDHEGIGADFLRARGFSETVAQLVLAHVAAKRYLVATNPAYAARLSAASTETLKHQGGPMGSEEVAAFDQDPLKEDKLRMRSWDEMGKKIGLEVPGLETYREMILRHLEAHEL